MHLCQTKVRSEPITHLMRFRQFSPLTHASTRWLWSYTPYDRTVTRTRTRRRTTTTRTRTRTRKEHILPYLSSTLKRTGWRHFSHSVFRHARWIHLSIFRMTCPGTIGHVVDQTTASWTLNNLAQGHPEFLSCCRTRGFHQAPRPMLQSTYGTRRSCVVGTEWPQDRLAMADSADSPLCVPCGDELGTLSGTGSAKRTVQTALSFSLSSFARPVICGGTGCLCLTLLCESRLLRRQNQQGRRRRLVRISCIR